MSKFEELRRLYKYFIYKDFNVEKLKSKYHVEFIFDIPNLCEFKSIWEFPIIKDVNEDILNKLLFNLGMVETISYWKCVCPPTIIIQCGGLTKKQCAWWKKLYYNGLGEFLFRNNIDIDKELLLEIEYQETNELPLKDDAIYEGCLVPIGGGKDSVVSLEVLKNENITTYCINGNETTSNIINMCEYKQGSYVAKRILDPQLLRLNSQGYLNGHIPFSAVVAFSAVIAAFLNGNKYIALSNETSANETTVANSFVNHQYSKSYEFEKDFFWYMKTLISSDIYYFSLLRPLTEIQIAALFAKCKKYHKVFRSCNVGSKEGIWCCECPKCLFVYIILLPFLSQGDLSNIFGENLLDKESLDCEFKGLTGIDDNKPFECVGTRREVLIALKDYIEKGGRSLLTERYKDRIMKINENIKDILNEWEKENNVPKVYQDILKRCLNNESGR